MKRHSLLESIKRLVQDLPRLNPSGAFTPVQFASSSGGGGRYDDSDDDYFDDVPEESERTPRRDDTQATAGRRRTVQSEPDDRYWTDYLRIALPVIGLLLVIAVFWFWAQQLIDGDSNEDITATEPGIAEGSDTSTVEPTDAAETGTPVPTEPEEGNTSEDGQQVEPPTAIPSGNQEEQAQPSPTPSPDEPEQTAPEPPSGEQVEDILAGLTAPADIEADTTVVVTEDGGGLAPRSESTAAPGEENVVTRLDAGTELTVVAGPEESENFVWWQVVVVATGEAGWVVEDFIEPAT